MTSLMDARRIGGRANVSFGRAARIAGIEWVTFMPLA